ncbi:MAG TPA: hypothetical protein VF533_16825 [Solirubrobacteraceae bacterium]
MAYLRYADKASRLAQIDKSGVRLLPELRSRISRRTAARDVSGHLGDIAGKPAAVYVAGGRLWLAIDGQPWYLDEIDAEVLPSQDGWHVRITTPAQTYAVAVDTSSLRADTTPFLDPEDFFFGLWAARIIQEPQRQEVLLDVLADAPLDTMPVRASPDSNDRTVEMREVWGRARDVADGRPESSD